MNEQEELLERVKELAPYFPNWNMEPQSEYEQIVFKNGKLSFRIVPSYSGKISVYGSYPYDLIGKGITIYNEKNKVVHSPSLDIYFNNFSLEEVAEKIHKKFLLQFMEHWISVDRARKTIDAGLKAQKEINEKVCKLLGISIDKHKEYECADMFFDGRKARGKFKAGTTGSLFIDLSFHIYSMEVLKKIAKVIR